MIHFLPSFLFGIDFRKSTDTTNLSTFHSHKEKEFVPVMSNPAYEVCGGKRNEEILYDYIS